MKLKNRKQELLLLDYLILSLCRLAVVFLAFDVFFAIFCVVLACLIGIALCCCLPCIIAILYAVAGQVRGYLIIKGSVFWPQPFLGGHSLLSFLFHD